tara:strand:- start:260 stop:487 length:228 start_codon:yes stop_codon:yes gene_type:complete
MDTNAALIIGDIFSLIFGKTKRLEIGINVSEAIRRNSPDTKDEFIIANNEIIKNKIPNTQLAKNEAYFIDKPLFN